MNSVNFPYDLGYGLLCLLLFINGAHFSGSSKFGRIEGLVIDEERKPIAGVAITITATTAREPYPEISPLSNGEGKFGFPNLPEGDYTLRAIAKDYLPQTSTAEVRAGKSTRVEFLMRKRG